MQDFGDGGNDRAGAGRLGEDAVSSPFGQLPILLDLSGIEDERRAAACQPLRHRGDGFPPGPDIEDRGIDVVAADNGQRVAHGPAAAGDLSCGFAQDRFEFHEKEGLVLRSELPRPLASSAQRGIGSEIDAPPAKGFSAGESRGKGGQTRFSRQLLVISSNGEVTPP